jgi:hypothetical protein
MTSEPNEALTDLIERVGGLTGASREVDRDLFFLAECEPIPEIGVVCDWIRLGYRWMPGDKGRFYMQGTVPTDGGLAPAYTDSTDAALALAEKLTGDRWYSVLLDAMREFGAAGTLGPEHLARFIVAALLRALSASKGDTV